MSKTRAKVLHDVPWKFHHAVMLSLDLRPEVLMLPCLQRFGKIPCCHGSLTLERLQARLS